MNQVKSTHHTIDHFGSVKYAELVDPTLLSQTSTLLWKCDKLPVHCDVKHKNNFLYRAITVWTTSVKRKQMCDCFYGSVWRTVHDTSVVMQDFWHALLHVWQATSLLLNLAIRLRYMTTWNYNRTDTIIMIKSAGAKFPPEYSDRNLIVKTRCVKQMWLSGNCKASLVVFVSSKTQLARLIQSSLQQPLQHGTVVAVFLYVLLLLYLSLIPIPQNSAHYLTFPLDT